jgi:hypothetical protein
MKALQLELPMVCGLTRSILSSQLIDFISGHLQLLFSILRLFCISE